jgi:hypothetical protein
MAAFSVAEALAAEPEEEAEAEVEALLVTEAETLPVELAAGAEV